MGNSFWQCFSSGSYTFTIKDAFGDGICCSYGNGGYSVEVDDKEVASGGQFGSSETKTFDVGSSSPTIPPSTSAPVSPPTSRTPGAPTMYPTQTAPTMYPTHSVPDGSCRSCTHSLSYRCSANSFSYFTNLCIQ